MIVDVLRFNMIRCKWEVDHGVNLNAAYIILFGDIKQRLG